MEPQAPAGFVVGGISRTITLAPPLRWRCTPAPSSRLPTLPRKKIQGTPFFFAPGRVLAYGDLAQGSLGLVGTLNNQHHRVGFWRTEGGHDASDQLAGAWRRATVWRVCG